MFFGEPKMVLMASLWNLPFVTYILRVCPIKFIDVPLRYTVTFFGGQ